jgi:hypothetical protein
LPLNHGVARVSGSRCHQGNAAGSTSSFTHPAPVKVLPQPRPAMASQPSHSPSGGS